MEIKDRSRMTKYWWNNNKKNNEGMMIFFELNEMTVREKISN